MSPRPYSLAIIALLLPVAASAASTTQGKTSSSPTVTYLSSLKPVALNGRPFSPDSAKRVWKTGPCSLQGAQYLYSFTVGRGSRWTNEELDEYYPDAATTVFSLGGKYNTFEATAGVSDQCANSNLSVTFAVIVDGRVKDMKPGVRVGQPVRISVPVIGAGRLELIAASKGGGFPRGFALSDIWWGDARIVQGKTVAPGPSKPPPPTRDIGEPPIGGMSSSGTKVLSVPLGHLKTLAESIQTDIRETRELEAKPSLAIASIRLISMPGDDLAPSNAENLREDLTTALVNTKTFTVVERSQLDKALEELKLGLKDTFDSETIQRLGKLAKARLVLIGTLSDRGSHAVINVRVLDTQTGQVVSAASCSTEERA